MTFFNLKKILAPNRTPCDHSAVASKPMIGAWSPVKSPSGPTRSATESNVISTIGRNASDAAQTFLPPVQAVAGAVPCVGGIIKGVIGGLIGTLQLVDVIQLHSRVLCIPDPKFCLMIELRQEQR